MHQDVEENVYLHTLHFFFSKKNVMGSIEQTDTFPVDSDRTFIFQGKCLQMFYNDNFPGYLMKPLHVL